MGRSPLHSNLIHLFNWVQNHNSDLIYKRSDQLNFDPLNLFRVNCCYFRFLTLITSYSLYLRFKFFVLFWATSNLMIFNNLNFVFFKVDLNPKVIRDIYLTTDFSHGFLLIKYLKVPLICFKKKRFLLFNGN
jgi:hypothetical protein